MGDHALYGNTTGNDNTAIGSRALAFNITGSFNTSTGNNALLKNKASNNTADGFDALLYNITGSNNTALGYQAMNGTFVTPSTGANNTATGFQALYSYTTGGSNTASGYQALYSNTTGTNNTADGNSALLGNTTGSFNIALGNNAGTDLTIGIYNIDIGNPGVGGESKTIRIGKQGTQTATYIAGISRATIPTGIPVIVDDSGHLGTTTSSARFKEGIQPMDKVSEALLALKPVTFHYKHDLDPEGIPQFGLVAEEVEKVNPDLVARDEQGKPYTVRYDAVNAMLLNEFLKEHRKVETLEAKLAKLEATVEKVSAQLELSKAASQITATNQ